MTKLTHTLAFAFALFSLPAVGWPVATTFINELHYDNSGTDVGEGVEIAGAAGTNLAGWNLVLYNGSNGSAYGTLALDGTLPDAGGGSGVLYFALDGLQNGPDGLALVDASGQPVQFLSYEGAFTATDGLAAGLESMDIGVFEESGTAAGLSLQLTGLGTTYDDFVWSAPGAGTYNLFNTGQTFAPVPVPAALPLFGLALAGLGLLRVPNRRR